MPWWTQGDFGLEREAAPTSLFSPLASYLLKNDLTETLEDPGGKKEIKTSQGRREDRVGAWAMSDDKDKGHCYAGGWPESGFDGSIPIWDGRADSLCDFKRTVTWWLWSIDLSKTIWPPGLRRSRKDLLI